MWITMDRNGLVEDLKNGEAAKRAHAVLNSHQVLHLSTFHLTRMNYVLHAFTPILLHDPEVLYFSTKTTSSKVAGSRCFLPEDRVLALVPLVNYGAWRTATDHIPGKQLVQASVSWAYQHLEDRIATFRCRPRLATPCDGWKLGFHHSPREIR